MDAKTLLEKMEKFLHESEMSYEELTEAVEFLPELEYAE